MNENYRILCINPGSTTTKLALFENEVKLDETNLEHSAKEIAEYKDVVGQLPMRKKAVDEYLASHKLTSADIDVIAARGAPDGKRYHAGAYRITQDMIDECMKPANAVHPMCLAPVIAYEWVKEYDTPAFCYDVVYVDEMSEIAHITGLPDVQRSASGHTLNTRAVAREVAEEMGTKYEDVNFIMCHLGGGCSVSMHEHGKITDIVAGGEGTFTPSRMGGLSYKALIKLCYSGKYTEKELKSLFQDKCGFVAHLGTNDCREVEAMIEDGNEKASLLYEAFAYNLAKDIGRMAVTTRGEVDGIVLTGGIAYSKMLMNMVAEYVGFIAPVIVRPGAKEMEALVRGVLRVLRGEEAAHDFREEF